MSNKVSKRRMCFTETWLHEHLPDSVFIDCSKTVRVDCDKKIRGKIKERGNAELNHHWCHPGHATVKEKTCTRDMELLDVSFCLYYLLREFTCVYCGNGLYHPWYGSKYIILTMRFLGLQLRQTFCYITNFPAVCQLLHQIKNKMLDLFVWKC